MICSSPMLRTDIRYKGYSFAYRVSWSEETSMLSRMSTMQVQRLIGDGSDLGIVCFYY